MKYGLEKEIFLLDENRNVLIVGIGTLKGLPIDEGGCLLEARGKAYDDIVEAVYSLNAEEYRIKQSVKKINPMFILCDDPLMKVTRDFKREVRRHHDKGKLTFENMYGFADNRHSQNELTAAVHVSFTNPYTEKVFDSKGSLKEVTFNRYFDFIKYVKAFDKAFKEEIKAAKRNPGFYEVKSDGRVEYRSLPSNVDLTKVIEVINNIK